MRKSLLTALITLMTFSTAPAFLQKAEAQTAQWLPENQSLNILDYASQIVRMDYKQMDRNPSREACKTESQNQATSLGRSKK